MYKKDLIQRIVKSDTDRGVSVADFAPNGILTNTNFEAALRAAITAAYALSGSPEDGEQGVCNVYVPRGRWTINSTISFPGSYPKYTPGLIGEGEQGAVVFVFPVNVYPWIEIGTNNPAAPNEIFNYASHQTIKNIELRANGGAAYRGGIKTWLSILSTFEDVRVAGIQQQGGNYPKWNECIGFDFQQYSGGLSNIQHLRLVRCHSDFNLIGFRFGEALWSCTAIDTHANSCMVAGALYESGSVVKWVGGNTQCGPQAYSGQFWWESTEQAVHCTGAAYTTGMPSGTGASISAKSAGLSTLTGLSGLQGYFTTQALSHKGCWIELTDTSPTSPDLISGLYRIEEVLSATSCTIRKGSNHLASNSDITWQVRTSAGGQNVSISGVYHEGGAYALASIASDFVSESRWSFESTEANNCTFGVEQIGGQGSLTIKQVRVPGGKVAKLRHCWESNISAEITQIDTDMFSMSRLVARHKGNIWDAKPRATRYNRALRERGAIFAVDARNTASFSMSAPNITTWTDFIGNVVGVKLNAGVSPQYVASDSALGAPAVLLTGGASGTALGGLTWDITDRFRTPTAGMTLIVVGRLPNTTVSGTNRIITVRNGDMFVNSTWHDGVYLATGNYGTMYSTFLGGQSASALLGAVNT